MKDNTDNLTYLTVHGIKWRAYAKASDVLSHFIIVVILARILSPQDFGLVGIAQIFAGIGIVVINTGIGSALIQKKLTQNHLSSSFFISLLVGITFVILIFFLSPIIAVFFKNQQVVIILRLISLSLISDSLTIVPISLIKKKLDFKSFFLITFTSYLIGFGFIAVFLAFMDFGIYSLVGGILGRSIIRLILSFTFFPQDRSLIKFKLFRKEAMDIIKFGLWTMSTNLVNYGAKNIDYFIVGKLLSSYFLGIYTNAYKFVQLGIISTTEVISSVLFPSLSKIKDDPAKLRKIVLGILPLFAQLLFIISTFLFINSENIIIGLLGKKWIDAILPFQILSVAFFFRGLYRLLDTVILSLGKVKIQFVIHSLYAIFILLGSVLGTRWGLKGVSVGVGMGIFFTFVLLYAYCSFLLKIKIKQLATMFVLIFICNAFICSFLLIFNWGVQLIEIKIIKLLLNGIFIGALILLVFYKIPNILLTNESKWILVKIKNNLPAKFKNLFNQKKKIDNLS